MKDIYDLQSIKDLVAYLQYCIDNEDNQPNHATAASRIVGLAGNDNWEKWYNDVKIPEFQQIYETASDFEAFNVYRPQESDWLLLKFRIKQLAEKVAKQA